MIFFNENNLTLTEGTVMDVPATNMGIELGEAGCYRALHESTNEWFNIREKMMKLEHHAYVTEDTLLLEAGTGNFFKKIAALFKKLLGMVKEMWANFIKKFNALTMKDKEFAKKYAGELRTKAASANLKVKGYTYDGLDGKLAKMSSVASASLNKSVTEGRAMIADAAMASKNSDLEGKGASKLENKEEDFNELRGALIGQGSVESDDFSKKAYEYLRGADEEGEIAVNVALVEKFIGILNANEKELKKLENIKSSLEVCYSNSASMFEKLSAEIDKTVGKLKDGEAGMASTKGVEGASSADVKGNFKGTKNAEMKTMVSKSNDVAQKAIANSVADAIRKASSIVQTALAMGIEVFKQRHAFSRATLGKVLTAKAAPVKNESYGFATEGDILDRF